jgi:hypothetical protein
MENVSNISSEEELLQLRNEGKISENEYEELRETLQKRTNVDVGESGKDDLKPARTSGLAIASLVLSLIGPFGCIPAIVCGHIALRKIRKDARVQGRGLALAGLIIGYVGLCLLIVPITLIFLLYGWRAKSYTTSRVSVVAKPKNAKIEIAISELKHYSLDTTEGILTQSGVTIDKKISSDGNGSLRIEATEPTTIRLFETGDIDIEDARLIYQARVRTEKVEGQVYLEMWCHIASLGDFFSRGLDRPLTGSTDWVTEDTPFFLKAGQNPDNVKLNLVIDGKGTVWIDDVRLLKGPPQ